MSAGAGDRPPPPPSGGASSADADAGEPAPLAAAVRAAGEFDRGAVEIVAGVLAAIPVAAVLGAGIALGQPVVAVTMGAGAMLVGIAWRTGGGRPPLALMAVDALVMALSTFAGCVSGSVGWIHLAVVFVWSLAAGLMSSLGARGAVVGTQAMIAVVVFGRFSEPAWPALGLAASVLAGGLAQVVFQATVRYPSPLRVQRKATASAYRQLAERAESAADASTLPAAEALDEAEASLASPALFGDAAVMTLRSLVNEGRRIRLQLGAIHILASQQRSLVVRSGALGETSGERVLELAGRALRAAAAAIEGEGRAAEALEPQVQELSTLAEDLSAATASSSLSLLARSTTVHLARRSLALAGQLRAVAGLAPAAGVAGGLRNRRPHSQTSRPIERLRADLEQMRANASLASPAGRHALRLAVVVLVAELLARGLPLQRSYWMVVAAAAVLRPEFGATFTRGTERALGTCLGAALAGAITVALHPSEGVTVVLVGLLAWAAYSTFPANWAVGFGFITAVVVFLLNAVNPDTLGAASARLLDTLVGGTIGLLGWVLWPTWSVLPARQALGDLVEAQRLYLHKVLAALVGGRQVRESEVRPLARGARLARTTAESTVARSLSEPATRRIDAEQSQNLLAAMRRLVQAAHVLRLDAEEDRGRLELPALQPLADDIDLMLMAVEETLRGRGGPDERPPWVRLPDLRADYEAFAGRTIRDSDGAALLAELDEIVDAANVLATLVRLDPVDRNDSRPRALPSSTLRLS